MTPGRKKAGLSTPGAVRNGTYVACLDCGQEFTYDWQSMRIGQPMGMPVPQAEGQPVAARARV